MDGARYCEEDATEGLVWPPRSYFCNFCGREFGSAQALGGHMNVHRRDRAKLNQSPGLEKDLLRRQNPRKIVRSEYPYSQLQLVYNPKSSSTSAFGSSISKPADIAVSDGKKLESKVSSKRWRSEESLLPSFPLVSKLKSNSMKNIDHQLQEEGGTQDLDLELRLGFPFSSLPF